MIIKGCYWNTKLAQQEDAVPVVGDKKMLSFNAFLYKIMCGLAYCNRKNLCFMRL